MINDQNLYGQKSSRSKTNSDGGGRTQEREPLPAPGVINDSSEIDFSQSLTQILASLEQNLNTNPKEGFNTISACTDTWKETMAAWQKKQEEKISGIEHQIFSMNNSIQESQQVQDNVSKLDEMVSWHKLVFPGLQGQVEATLREVKSVLAEVDRKMEEFKSWVSYVKPSDITAENPMEIVNSLNKIILDKSPSILIDSVCHRVEQLEGEIRVKGITTDSVRSAMIQLQEKVSNQSINTLEIGNTISLAEHPIQDRGSPKTNNTN